MVTARATLFIRTEKESNVLLRIFLVRETKRGLASFKRWLTNR